MNDYISEVFSPNGLFAKHYAGYEQREGQVALARKVDRAMRENLHCIGEAPCGTGKGMAYCVPAIWNAKTYGKKVVIATPNIALQEQLTNKDLPELQKILPWSFTYKLLKGRQNYLCLDRYWRYIDQYEDCSKEQQKEMLKLNVWAENSIYGNGRGDKAELDFEPSDAVAWRYTIDSSSCKRKLCEYYDDCFYEDAKREAFASDIIVTNYHMLFAHLQWRRKTGKDTILPKIDLLVLDEAHETADIAREFFGFTVTKSAVERLSKIAFNLREPAIGQKILDLSNTFFEELKWIHIELRRLLRGNEDYVRLTKPLSSKVLLSYLRTLAQRCEEIIEKPSGYDSEVIHFAFEGRKAEDVADHIEQVSTQADQNSVYTIELDRKQEPKIVGTMISMAPILNTNLFKEIPSVSLVSATMIAKETFNFVRREMGIPEGALEIIAPSPFDFNRQGLIVAPEGLPDPALRGREDREAYAFAVAKLMLQVIEQCNGRTLCLFTSYFGLDIAYDYISRRCDYTVLKQGRGFDAMPRSVLTAKFKEDRHSVLLGSKSFWTGIDVPGDSLTAVVIDRFPFVNPNDPVLEVMKERDKDWFWQYYISKAIINFRQAAGRAIRSQKDIGVIVIADPRVYTKNYGQDFLYSLPFRNKTKNLSDIRAFLEGQKLKDVQTMLSRPALMPTEEAMAVSPMVARMRLKGQIK